MDIVIPLFDRFTALDAVGPYEVLSRLPGARVVFAAVEARPYTTETRMLTLSADAALADLPHPEVIVVPGGTGTDEALGDERLVGWIRTAHESSVVDHLRLHRLAAARRRRGPPGPRSHDPLVRPP